MLFYKLDILEALKAAGYTTYRLRKEKLLGEATVQKLRDGEMIGINNLEIVCRLLDCQPGDLIGFKHKA